MRIATILFCATVLLVSWQPALAQEPECTPHEYQADAIKERLRRWRGMAAFNRWRLIMAKPDPCIVEGNIDVLLVLAPPVDWSRHRAPYRVSTRIKLDGSSGTALEGPEKGYRRLATGIRRLVLRAEEHEDVRRFLERYPPKQADITGANGPDTLKVTYIGDPDSDRPTKREPSLVFSEAMEAGVFAYQIPRMDGLPARPELLRFVEVMSRHHPRCLPIWIEAKAENGKSRQPAGQQPEEPESSPLPIRWKIKIDLKGEGCPGFFRGVLNNDNTVDDIKVQIPEPRTR